MSKLRLIAVALLATSAAAPFSTATHAEPLERGECKALQGQKQALLTSGVKAALSRGPDWVKEHLHKQEEIEKVREYLRVEEKVAFRCRTDGVRVPKPMPPPPPDRKPPVPTYVVESGTPKILAGMAATSFLPLRKPSLSQPNTAETATIQPETPKTETAATDAPNGQEAGDAGDTGDAISVIETTEAEPGPSQAVADSDMTAPSENKAAQ